MDLEKIMEFEVPEDQDVHHFEKKVDKVYKMLEDLTCQGEIKYRVRT